ncbi:sphingomyelin synthase-related protein 1 isoform X4 [Ascaphus truei]|uniref:sphingomyelin synthase-related protein 1 isoform X4 n=1 Tax=Ascaphus truei TaxID=8439 RepID=UPI003F5A1E5A
MTPQVTAKPMMSNSQLCIRRWTTKHVAKWLREEGFYDYVDSLCNRHRLDGTALLALTEYDLRSPPLEIKVLGDIKRLMLSIRKLQKQHASVLEELGLSSDAPAGALSLSSLPSPDWLCNGELSQDCDGNGTDSSVDQHQYSNGKHKHPAKRLDPEYWKTAISCVYVFIVFGFTSFVMVIVHERVPDMQTYPPLPDIFLDRHPSKLELPAYPVLGPQPVWHLLHPGRPRTLLHRRLHRLLHHHPALPVLPHLGQHPRLPAEPPSPYLVPHVLFLRVQREGSRSQRVLLALFPARHPEEFIPLTVPSPRPQEKPKKDCAGAVWPSEEERTLHGSHVFLSPSRAAHGSVEP